MINSISIISYIIAILLYSCILYFTGRYIFKIKDKNFTVPLLIIILIINSIVFYLVTMFKSPINNVELIPDIFVGITLFCLIKMYLTISIKKNIYLVLFYLFMSFLIKELMYFLL